MLGLLLFALALESFTLVVALREIGGWKGVLANRHNTTVLAVVLEDAVALLGIVLTLVVAGVSFAWGPHPAFDAAVAIAVGALLGAMALFLASINRRLLIDISDVDLDRAAQRFLAEQGVRAEVSSVVVDDDHAVVFLRALPGSARPFDTSDSYALGEALKAHLLADAGKTIDEVYWKFPAGPRAGGHDQHANRDAGQARSLCTGAISAAPAAITRSAPKRAISEPVTKPGAYMPTTCHSNTIADRGVRMAAKAHRQRRRRHQQVHHAVAERRRTTRRR